MELVTIIIAISILSFFSSAGLVIMPDYYRMMNNGQLMILLLGLIATALSLSLAIIHSFGTESRSALDETFYIMWEIKQISEAFISYTVLWKI